MHTWTIFFWKTSTISDWWSKITNSRSLFAEFFYQSVGKKNSKIFFCLKRPETQNETKKLKKFNIFFQNLSSNINVVVINDVVCVPVFKTSLDVQIVVRKLLNFITGIQVTQQTKYCQPSHSHWHNCDNLLVCWIVTT